MVMNDFPKLTKDNHQITSPPTFDYNCIGWAAGEDDRWWWPDPDGISYWPSGVIRHASVDAFVAAFGTLGYTVCEHGDAREGFEKVVLYTQSGVPTHMARQLKNGRWTSKLGREVDIWHLLPESIEGPAYGDAHMFLERPLP